MECTDGNLKKIMLENSYNICLFISIYYFCCFYVVFFAFWHNFVNIYFYGSYTFIYVHFRLKQIV